MNLREMDPERRVAYLRSLLRSGKNSLTAYVALFALRHFLALKHSQKFSQKPVPRWYLGQLAKEYIAGIAKEVRRCLENLADIGLLVAGKPDESGETSYYLNEELYASLCEVLEEIFGKEYVANMIARAKYYRDPGAGGRKDD